MNLKAVAKRLHDTNTARAGVNLFIGFMPTERDGVLLRPPFGGTKIDHELPGYLQTSFQLIVRGVNYEPTEAQIKAAVTALTVQDLQVGPVFFRYMRPRTEPLNYPISQGARHEFLVNIDACYIDTGAAIAAPSPARL